MPSTPRKTPEAPAAEAQEPAEAPAEASQTTEPTPEQKARTEALTKAYGLASKELREIHLPEFNDLRVKYAKEAGYEWTPKPTAEEKAREALAKLLAEHPGLASSLPATGDVSEPDED